MLHLRFFITCLIEYANDESDLDDENVFFLKL